MSIKDFKEKIKLFWGNLKNSLYSPEKGLRIEGDVIIVLIIILVGTASFGLGKLSALEKKKTPISVYKTQESMVATVFSSIPKEDKGLVVASKSGTKYYYPWCSGVSKIKEENKVWFNTIEEARAKGLTPASNCTGLK
jgi:hypothetical protein